MKRFLDCHVLHTLSLPVTERDVLWEMEFGNRTVEIAYSVSDSSTLLRKICLKTTTFGKRAVEIITCSRKYVFQPQTISTTNLPTTNTLSEI